MTLIRRAGTLPMLVLAALTAGIVLATTPAAAGSAGTPGWPQFQGNAAHTGDEPAERSVNRQNVGQLTVAWTQPLVPCGCGILTEGQVTVTGGTAYAIGAATVYAFSAATGAPLWHTTLPSTALGTPAVQGGLVLVGYNDPEHRQRGFVAALDSATGATVWSKEVGAMNPASLSQGTSITATAHRAYVSLNSGQVTALTLSSGNLYWKSAVLPGADSLHDCVLSPPSVSAGYVVVGTGGETVTALNAGTGAVAWSRQLGTGGCGNSVESWLPAIGGGTAYAGWMGGLAAISLATGDVDWDNTSYGNGTFFPLSVTGSEVIAAPSPASGNEVLLALSRADGSLLWQTTATRSEATVSTFGGLTWTLSSIGTGTQTQAAAFDIATGRLVYAGKEFSDDIEALPPVVDAGRVYVDTGTKLVCMALPALG